MYLHVKLTCLIYFYRTAEIKVKIEPKAKKPEVHYGFFVELPLEINPEKCKHEIEKGKITLVLRKADPDKNWESYEDEITPKISNPNT